jgi:hypothetical protein
MSGAPALSGTAGALIGVLDGCLVDGFGSVTLDSLVVASNVATATVSGGHQFAMIGDAGPVITIAGANPSGLNGEWRMTVTSATAFTFATTGIGDQTATGTITAKRAPAGFEKAFSGTNLAAYRSLDVMGTRRYLRVNDTGTTSARAIGYESMSGISSGLVGPFPTDAQLSGGYYVYKSSAASSATRAWRLYADARLVYLHIDAAVGTWPGGLTFGDIFPYLTHDAYAAILQASASAAAAVGIQLLSQEGGFFARSYLQTGSAVPVVRYSHAKTAHAGNGGQDWPSPINYAVHVWPIEVWESTTAARGILPGAWNPIHDGVPDGELLTSIPQLPGRTLVTQMIDTSYNLVFDLSGPWR